MKFHRSRALIAIPLLASVVLLSSASAQTHVCAPSRLDYLVLASFADSSSLVAMSTYRGQKGTGKARGKVEIAPAQ
jgi:hypothetical protein